MIILKIAEISKFIPNIERKVVFYNKYNNKTMFDDK